MWYISMNFYSFVGDIGTYVAGHKKFGVLHEESAFILSFNCLSVVRFEFRRGGGNGAFSTG
jgi:hypothetical protein